MPCTKQLFNLLNLRFWYILKHPFSSSRSTVAGCFKLMDNDGHLSKTTAQQIQDMEIVRVSMCGTQCKSQSYPKLGNWIHHTPTPTCGLFLWHYAAASTCPHHNFPRSYWTSLGYLAVHYWMRQWGSMYRSCQRGSCTVHGVEVVSLWDQCCHHCWNFLLNQNYSNSCG